MQYPISDRPHKSTSSLHSNTRGPPPTERIVRGHTRRLAGCGASARHCGPNASPTPPNPGLGHYQHQVSRQLVLPFAKQASSLPPPALPCRLRRLWLLGLLSLQHPLAPSTSSIFDPPLEAHHYPWLRQRLRRFVSLVFAGRGRRRRPLRHYAGLRNFLLQYRRKFGRLRRGLPINSSSNRRRKMD
jgi:hypothetical protein